MSAVFRRDDRDPIEVSGSWTIDQQIEQIQSWLSDSENAALVRGSILDIGFNSRLDGGRVAVQGETIPLEFMRKLVDSQITLWLSLYPQFSDGIE
jgi:hypothetical protein